MMFGKPRKKIVPIERLPEKPFVLKDGQYQLIDGDTLSVNWYPNDHSLRIRFSKVNTPEVSRSYQRPSLMHAGVEATGSGPGARAHQFCKALLKNKCLLIVPDRQHETGLMHDRYGRLLARVYASSNPYDFVPEAAFDVEHELYKSGQAMLVPGQRLGDVTAVHTYAHWERLGHDFTPETAAKLSGFIREDLGNSGPSRGKWIEERGIQSPPEQNPTRHENKKKFRANQDVADLLFQRLIDRQQSTRKNLDPEDGPSP